MAKSKSWFGWVKKFFTCREKSKRENDYWRWSLVRQHPALMASQRVLCEAAEEQKKHALTVAVATAAAAEAAVAAAQAAAEVVRLTGASGSGACFRKLTADGAAIRIQSAYRAHLARKALRALKGIVRLQAIIRGRAVRRRTYIALKRLRSDRKRLPEYRERIISAKDQCTKNVQKSTLFLGNKNFEEDLLKFEGGSQGEWNCSALSREDVEIVLLKREEAAMKRERMKRYSSSHRERRSISYTLQDSFSKKDSGAQSGRLQPLDGQEKSGQTARRGMRERQREPLGGGKSSEFPLLRVESYMAPTESVKAKTRSMSIPKQRVGFWDGCLNGNHPHERRLSVWSSYDGESFWRSRD